MAALSQRATTTPSRSHSHPMDSPYCHKIKVEVNHPTSPSLQRQNFRCPKGAKRVEVKGLSIVPDARLPIPSFSILNAQFTPHLTSSPLIIPSCVCFQLNFLHVFAFNSISGDWEKQEKRKHLRALEVIHSLTHSISYFCSNSN